MSAPSVTGAHYGVAAAGGLHIGDGPAAGLLPALLRAGVRESSAQGPGAASTLAQVAELLFVEALRRYLDQLPLQDRGRAGG